MSSKFSFSVCRVCFAPECISNLSSLFEGKLEKAEKFQSVTRVDVSLVLIFDYFPTIYFFSHSQIYEDQGKHDAMICDRCLKELIAAFEFAERSRSAEKLYFVKLREEIEAEKQTPEGTKETEMTEIKIKREPSIDIEDVEIEMFDDSEMNNESEANEACSYEDDEMDANLDREEESAQMFALEVTTKSSSSLKQVVVSTHTKKTAQRKQQKPFQCPICFKTLSTNQNLQQHVESVHEKKTLFTCPHCPKAFYRKQHLQRHITRHTFTKDDTTNSNRPLECDVDNCGKFFKTKGELRAHQVVHLSEFTLKY
jgi:RNase P subunit RPR2